MTDHIVTAAPASVLLDGKEFRLHPLNDRDIEALNLWLRANHLRTVRASFDEDTSESEKNRIEVVAQRVAMDITWMHGQGAAMMASPVGLARILWQSTRRDHPDMTMDDFNKMMFNPANVNEVNAAFESLNGNVATSGEGGNGNSEK